MTTTVDPTWIVYAKEFQTLIVGLLGFGGIILTIRSQGKQNRASHDYEVTLAAKSIKLALEAEIETLASNLEAAAQSTEERAPKEGHVGVIPAIPQNHVYKSLVSKFDALAPDDVVRITRSNLYYENLFARLNFIGTPSNIPGHIAVPAKNYPVLVDLQRNSAQWMRNPPDQ